MIELKIKDINYERFISSNLSLNQCFRDCPTIESIDRFSLFFNFPIYFLRQKDEKQRLLFSFSSSIVSICRTYIHDLILYMIASFDRFTNYSDRSEYAKARYLRFTDLILYLHPMPVKM